MMQKKNRIEATLSPEAYIIAVIVGVILNCVES